MKDALAVVRGMIDIFLYLSVVEILYSISEQLWKDGLRQIWWVKWYLLSVQMIELKNTDKLWGMEDLRQITYTWSRFFSSYMIDDNKRYHFPLQTLSLMSLHHNNFNNIAITEVWALHGEKTVRDQRSCRSKKC